MNPLSFIESGFMTFGLDAKGNHLLAMKQFSHPQDSSVRSIWSRLEAMPVLMRVSEDSWVSTI